jgi:hypothetical protein
MARLFLLMNDEALEAALYASRRVESGRARRRFMSKNSRAIPGSPR